ncbi:MAG: hypothetical protein Q9191_004828 [Dirinaria sp. TL-2023a]
MADANQSQQQATLGATIPFAILAVIAVICRFVARRIQKLRFEFDDYAILVGLVCTLGCFTLSMEMTHLGSGKHIQTVPLGNIPQYSKCLFAYEILYGTAIMTIKLSVLSLYRRIFSVRKFKLAANVVAAVVVAWWIAILLVSIFSCNPVNGFWDKTYTKSKCINTKKFFVGNAVPNIVTDIVILTLPLREVWRLNTQRHQKIALSITFLLGGFVVVASLVRLREQFKVDDPDFTSLRLFPQLSSTRTPRYVITPEQRYYKNLDKNRTGMRHTETFMRQGDVHSDGIRTTAYAERDSGVLSDDVQLENINVKRDLHVMSEMA